MNQDNKNIEKIEHHPQRKNYHKYIFSKHNILNHENSIESIETKLATNTKEYNTKNYLTNSNNNSILNKLKNKIKEKQEFSYMIIESKKYKKTIQKRKKTCKSLEKNKKQLKKRKKIEEIINNRHSDVISPMNKADIFKSIQNNLHKRVNSSHIYNKVEKEHKHNKSFRETKKKIKLLNNKTLDLSIDNNNNNDDSVNENKKNSLTSMNNNGNYNIDNDEYLLSEQKNDLNEEEIINNEEIINMSKKKEKLLEEIKLKKQELKLTELNLEILRHKYKKKSNEKINPSSSSHITNKIISNYDFNVSLQKNPITKKNTTINNNSSSLNKKFFFGKACLYKNMKKISPYKRDVLELKHPLVNDRLNQSFKLRSNNHIPNANIKIKNNNKPKNKENSPYDKRMFSLSKKKIENKNNLSVKYVSPEKKNENSSIEIVNYIANKNNHNQVNKNKVKINNSINIKNKNSIVIKKKNIKKDGNIEDKINYNSKKNKTKSKEDDKNTTKYEKFPENFLDQSKLAKLKMLSNISFLYDDMKNTKFPKVESYESHKNEELSLKTGKIDKLFKNKTDKLKPKENNIIPILRNANINKQKTKKIKNRVISSKIIRHDNIKEENKDISVYIKMNYQESLPEKNKKIDDLLNNRKSQENIKKPIFKLKLEKNQ